MADILVDTSVWVNSFKGIETDASLFLKNIKENISIVTCPVIVQEVLQGVVIDKSFNEIKTYFSNLILLPPNTYENSLEAAKLYRYLRKKGITIRSSNDCLIAVYAIKNNIALLHDDRDFTNIASFSELKTVRF